MNEFSLIERFFKSISLQRKEVLMGIGDDAACLQIPIEKNLLVSTDTLVSGVHFLPQWNPYDIAYRAVMVNISDLAAMAAEPCWITLALTLPSLDEEWLGSFAQGLEAALKAYHVDLIGGDTTKGPLSITITIMGLAPKGKAIKRNGAKPGDTVFVSGSLGAAALAVKYLSDSPLSAKEHMELMESLFHPQPRVDLADILRTYACAAIDISDGLSADLNHLCVASGVGACLTKKAIPIHKLLKKYLGSKALDLALTGGDDYELCFTVSASLLDSFLKESKKIKQICYPIGVIEEGQGLRMILEDNTSESLVPAGYNHFGNS